MTTSNGIGQLPAWITAFVAIGALLATTYFQWDTRRNQVQDELREHRRNALFAALKVIDNVYSNEPLSDGKAPNPHVWDIQLARDADNQMRVYCQYPETVNLFRKALGLYNPQLEKPHGVDLKALDEFRKQVAKELDLKEPIPSDPNLVWIGRLTGTAPSDSTGKPEGATQLSTGQC
jgi:hypothetical protein